MTHHSRMSCVILPGSLNITDVFEGWKESKDLYIYILDVFLFSCKVLLESGECHRMISQCVNTAMEYSSNKPEERAEHILC